MRKLLALALYLFLGLPALLGGLFLFPAKSWLLDRDFYRQIVSGPEIRAVLQSPALYEGYKGKLTANGITLDGPAAGKALEAALPVTPLLTAAEGVVDSAFDAIEASPPARRISVDLGALKSSIAGGVPEFSRIYSREAPSASLASMALKPPDVVLDLSIRPANLSESDFQSLVSAALASQVSAIPQTAVAELPSPSTPSITSGRASTAKDALNRGAIWLLLLGGGLWVAGAFIASDSAAKRLKWLGSTLVLPGIIVLATGVLLRFAADPLVLRTVQDPELQKFLSDPSLAAVRAWIHRPLWTISSGFLVSGSIAVILGGGISASRKALKYRDFE